MKRKKHPLKRWFFAALFLLIVAAPILWMTTRKDKGTLVTIAASERGDITSVVTATGKIQPQVEVRISSEVAGEIVELPVRDGQAVKRGDLLVRINPDTLEAQVAQQEASLAASRANAEQARAEMLQREIDLGRNEELFSKGATSIDAVDKARTALEVARAAYQASLHNIERQEMQLREARDTLEKASIYAPIDGTVTMLNSELGDRVVGTGQFAGTEIMRVANLDNMEVRVDVSENDIVSINIGDEATIEVDAIRDREFAGTVSEIANSAKVVDERTQDQLTTFEVKVRLTEIDPAIRPGMSATADIRTETVSGVVTVPLQAVTVRPRDEVTRQLSGNTGDEKVEGADRESGRGGNGQPAAETKSARERRELLQRVVFVARDGKVVITPVETGIADNKRIEITSGLEPGVDVVTGSYRALTRELKHNDRIRQQEKSPRGGKKPADQQG